jgi:hypothetical protein
LKFLSHFGKFSPTQKPLLLLRNTTNFKVLLNHPKLFVIHTIIMCHTLH